MRKTCLSEIYKLAKRDERVVFIGSDIGSGVLDEFKNEIPDRFFMEGVSESHIIGIMSGLALNGMIPYLNTVAVFLTRRCYEQVMLDAAKHNLKIRLIGSGGGLVYAPLGSTHLAFDDISIMRAIPNMTIIAPCDAEEMRRLMPQTLDHDGPIYIRLGKGGDPIVSKADVPFKIGLPCLIEEGKDVLFVSTGITLQLCLQAAKELKIKGISVGVLHVHTLKPIYKEYIIDAVAKVDVVLTVEEHSMIGGLGSIIAELIIEANFKKMKKFTRIALPDQFPDQYGSQLSLMAHYGITIEGIISRTQILLDAK